VGGVTYRERACGFCGFGFSARNALESQGHSFCRLACFLAWERRMNFTETEVSAIEKMLPPMGQYVAQSGIAEKPFSQCSREEILALFANTIRMFREVFAEELGPDCPF
jgi:hypothetical protein